MISTKAVIARKVQDHLEQLDWAAAIAEMEKLFAVDQDPHIRVRIGDVRQKLDMTDDAVREYVRAADMFAERGFFNKALAQYKLALRLDSSNEYARTQRMIVQSCSIFMSRRYGCREDRAVQRVESKALISSLI